MHLGHGQGVRCTSPSSGRDPTDGLRAVRPGDLWCHLTTARVAPASRCDVLYSVPRASTRLSQHPPLDLHPAQTVTRTNGASGTGANLTLRFLHDVKCAFPARTWRFARLPWSQLSMFSRIADSHGDDAPAMAGATRQFDVALRLAAMRFASAFRSASRRSRSWEE